MNIGLHHDREQRVIDPAASLQERREERPLPQPRQPQLEIPGRRCQSARASPVALGDTVRGSFERSCTDEGGRFRIDQFLIERFGRDTGPVGDIGEFQFPEELKEGRLV